MDIFAWKHISWSYQVSTEVVLQGYISWILYVVYVKDFLPHDPKPTDTEQPSDG